MRIVLTQDQSSSAVTPPEKITTAIRPPVVVAPGYPLNESENEDDHEGTEEPISLEPARTYHGHGHACALR